MTGSLAKDYCALTGWPSVLFTWRRDGKKKPSPKAEVEE